MLAACAKEQQVPAVQENGRQVSLSITDGGYSSADAPATRTVERGYATEFTVGDACGLYAVRGDRTVYSNVKLIAERDAATGKLVWKTADGTALAGMPDDHYYLYYPYQSDMDGKTADVPQDALHQRDLFFFQPLISSWQPNEDQGAQEAYTASDLMTAHATASLGSSFNMFEIMFYMSHRMALAVIDLPKTVYEFTDARVPAYTVIPPTTFTGAAKPLRSGDSFRYIVNPQASAAPTISGSFEDGIREFTITPSGLYKGYFKRFKVNGAPETRLSYTIQRGDFLLTDGNLLPRNAALTAEQKAKVAAIVFWTPAETETEGRITPARLSDDRIMSRDFPHCTHGLAVSCEYLIKVPWQNTKEWTADEFVLNFQNSDNFSRADKPDFSPIATLNRAEHDLNRVLGYQNTQILLSYNKWCRASGRGTIVEFADKLGDFAAANPAPEGSTGWYLPSAKELFMLLHKDIDDIYYCRNQCETGDILRNSFSMLEKKFFFDMAFQHWSSTETQYASNNVFNEAYYMNNSICRIGNGDKEYDGYTNGAITGNVTYVCAF